MKLGDRVRIINYSDWITKTGLTPILGTIRTIASLQSYSNRYPGPWSMENVWTLDNGYWAPEACLGLEYAATETEQKKEDSMLFAVTIMKTPKDTGVEEIAAATQELAAVDPTTATAFASADQAEAIKAIRKEGSRIRILTRQLG